MSAIVPMPIRSLPPALEEPADPVDPAAVVSLPPFVPFPWTLPNIVWTACAGAILHLPVGSLLWKLVT